MNKYNITIVIPTHYRHKYLERVLEYYKNSGFKILVADSTNAPFQKVNRYKIDYLHYTNSNFLLKLNNILKKVTTTYCVFCADDDFIFVDAIIKCCDFLDKNSDYVCAQGKLMSFKYSIKDNKLLYIIENYFKINKDKTVCSNVINRLSDFSNPYRHTFYGVHRTDNLKNIFQQVALHKINEPFLIELTQAMLLVLSGRIMNFSSFIYHLRELTKETSSSKYYDIPKLVAINHPEVAVVKHIIVEQLKQKYDISHNTCIDISEAFFEDFCDFVRQKKNMSQKFHTISLNKNTINHYDQQLLNELYHLEPDLRLAEELILKHKIFSGFLYQENSDLKSFSKNLLEINQIIEKLKLGISNADKIVIYGAGSFASLLIEVFNAQIEFIVDKNEDLAGKKLKDKDIKPIHMLSSQEVNYDVILVSVLGRNHEIRDYINQLNLKKVILFC